MKDELDDQDDIEFSASPGLWILFAVAILIGLLITH